MCASADDVCEFYSMSVLLDINALFCNKIFDNIKQNIYRGIFFVYFHLWEILNFSMFIFLSQFHNFVDYKHNKKNANKSERRIQNTNVQLQ